MIIIRVFVGMVRHTLLLGRWRAVSTFAFLGLSLVGARAYMTGRAVSPETGETAEPHGRQRRAVDAPVASGFATLTTSREQEGISPVGSDPAGARAAA
jgi:hypothetical protein